MYLKPNCIHEYTRRHDEIWPEIEQLLRDSGVEDYSIFYDEKTNALFAVQKTENEKNSQDLSENPIIQQWWDYMSDIIISNPNKSPISEPLIEVFHLD